MIKKAFERNAKAIKLRPSVGKSTGKSTIRVRDGTTCEIEGSGWNFTADIGRESGGNNQGPGPGVLERAALGSCLAIGYSIWAAVFEVPIDAIEVEIETHFDARGEFGVNDDPPGFTSVIYRVNIESPAPHEEVLRVLNEADKHSPVLDDFSRAIPIHREIKINELTE